ncbi:MAG: SurA N-terminal domain-containing protein [Pseudomonadota bacterium]
MISFFRRALSSWFVLGLLALVMIAFIVTGVEGPGAAGGASNGATVAKIDGQKVSSAELLRRIQNQFDAVRREQPTLDHKAFIAGGGFEGVTDGLINGRALESWGRQQGMAISKRLIDAQIAGMAAFNGVTGQFDESVMRNRLAQARISERELRADIAGELIRNQILTPAVALAPTPARFAQPYAALLLEERIGQVGIIPLAAFADPRLPTEAEIAAAYKASIATFTRPEARVLRYALFGAEQIAAQSVPTEAEIAAYYRENAPTYAARETRNLTQVIAPAEALARSIAAAAKGGQPLAAAAAKAGLEASVLTAQNKADYSGSSGEAVANQAFATASGGVAGPAKGSFGWYVVKVDAVTASPAQSLAQVRPEIVTLLTQQKAQEGLSSLAGKVEDAIADGSSFAEVAANNKLSIVETPALLASGQPIDRQDWKAPPELGALLKSGFAASPDDRPVVEAIVPDQQYALASVAKVIPPTPLPLAQVRPAVVRDIMVKRAAQRAKAVGDKIVAAVNRGTPLAKAIADSGAKLPPAQAARARQIDIARAQQSGAQIPEPVRALFALQKGKARLIPSERGEALFVTVLDQVVPGDLAKAPGLVGATQEELARASKAELGDQFIRAVGQDSDVKRYPDALAAAKRQFGSTGQ